MDMDWKREGGGGRHGITYGLFGLQTVEEVSCCVNRNPICFKD